MRTKGTAARGIWGMLPQEILNFRSSEIDSGAFWDDFQRSKARVQTAIAAAICFVYTLTQNDRSNSARSHIGRSLVYLFQSRNRLLLRRAIGRFAFPAHASVSSDHAPMITRTRYLPVIISYRPSFSLRSASGAPCQPDNSVLTHITHS